MSDEVLDDVMIKGSCKGKALQDVLRFIFSCIFSSPKKATEFAPDILLRNTTSASPQTNKKALIPLRIRAFPNFAFLRSGAYGTRTRDPMRDRHVF